MEDYDLALVQQVAANTTLATLNHLASAETARQETLIAFEQNHPGFFQRLNANRKILQEQRHALGEAITVAEQDARRQGDLIQLYECANDFLKVQGANGTRAADPARPSGRSLTAAEISKLPAAERRKVLDSMRDNLGDTSVDVADTSSETQLHY